MVDGVSPMILVPLPAFKSCSRLLLPLTRRLHALPLVAPSIFLQQSPNPWILIVYMPGVSLSLSFSLVTHTHTLTETGCQRGKLTSLQITLYTLPRLPSSLTQQTVHPSLAISPSTHGVLSRTRCCRSGRLGSRFLRLTLLPSFHPHSSLLRLLLTSSSFLL